MQLEFDIWIGKYVKNQPNIVFIQKKFSIGNDPNLYGLVSSDHEPSDNKDIIMWKTGSSCNEKSCIVSNNDKTMYNL